MHPGVGLRRRGGASLITWTVWSLVGACALLAGMLSGLTGAPS